MYKSQAPWINSFYSFKTVIIIISLILVYKVVKLLTWHYLYWLKLKKCREIQKNKIKNAINLLESKYLKDLPKNFNDQIEKIGKLDMVGVLELLKAQEITSTIQLKIYFKRSIDLGLKYNAITDFMIEEAFEQAQTLDQERLSGKIRSEQHGIPMSFKNSIKIKNYDTSCGKVMEYGILEKEQSLLQKF